MKITMLGCGTSLGVPVIGCDCAVCTGPNEKNKRLRASVCIHIDGRNAVIDTTPDFRQQCLRHKITMVDAVLLTHSHADHIHGLDDIRPFNYRSQKAMELFCDTPTEERVRTAFAYMFTDHNLLGGIPKVDLKNADAPFRMLDGSVGVTPLPVTHGSWTILGYRVGGFAYITDTNGIPESTYSRLDGLDLLILDALRFQKHPTHFSLQESIAAAKRIGATQTAFTHMSHDIDYDAVTPTLPAGMALAYDGQTWELPDPA